jgi:hypothetical protein
LLLSLPNSVQVGENVLGLQWGCGGQVVLAW